VQDKKQQTPETYNKQKHQANKNNNHKQTQGKTSKVGGQLISS
jgi:hypothetical protein